AISRPEDMLDLVFWTAEAALVSGLVEAKNRATAERDEIHARFFFTNPLPMYVVDERTNLIVAANEAAAALHDYSPEELRGRSEIDLVPVAERDAALARLQGKHGPKRTRTRHVRKNGALLDVETFERPTLFEGIESRLVTLIDRTGEQKLETQLRHAQKMDALGQLAGGVAHDFNNMLSVMLGYAASSLEDLDESSPHHEAFTEIRRAAERSAELTKKLLAFGRRQLTITAPLDLNAAIGESERLMRRLLGSNVELATSLTKEPLVVEADASQIEQAIVNLVVNARDAIDGARGRITVSSRLVDVDAAFVETHVGFRAGRYARVSVADDGVGMDAATQARIFEPFFTTKPQGKGTGLGLPIVFGIVEQAGGRVLVESEAGRGTTITLYLPIVIPRSSVAEIEAPISSARKPTETVLLVDDETQVLDSVALMLRRAGYRVFAAEDPSEALSIAADETIDLLLTDVAMPGMNGVDVALAVRKLRPDIKILYSSGYTRDVDLAACPGAFMQKPVTPHRLRKAVRAALEPLAPS
ncbi:MAG TPA: ATP-binding protein, partial [Polyangiaceae bacterium]